jgi:hypothetical protein
MPLDGARAVPVTPAGAGPAAAVVTRAGTVRRRPAGDLGTAFRGRAAGPGVRLAAFTLDAVVVALVVGAVALLTGSVTLVLVAGVEAVVALALLEARTGLTVGNALLRLRTAREDQPYSPGIGREVARAGVVGLGLLVAAAGAWVVVASAAWDPTGRRRSWADRAGGTVVVAVPPRERSGARQVPVVAPALRVDAHASMVTRTISSLSPRPRVDDEPGMMPLAPAPVQPSAQPPAPRHSAAPAAPVVPAVPQTGAPDLDRGVADTALMLAFDTGQRSLLPLGSGANLGRAPVASQPTDRLVAVQDPEGTVSKTHLRLEHGRDGVWVTDLGSTNGTDLLADDGTVARLVGGQRTALGEGTRVRVGNRVFTVSVVVREG